MARAPMKKNVSQYEFAQTSAISCRAERIEGRKLKPAEGIPVEPSRLANGDRRDFRSVLRAFPPPQRDPLAHRGVGSGFAVSDCALCSAD